MASEYTLQSFTQAANSAPPSRLGQRYSKTRFLPEAGNTVVCHLDIDTPSHAAVLKARQRMTEMKGSEGLLFTPPESLHMTLFNGALDTERAPGFWPQWLELDAALADVTGDMMQRLNGFQSPGSFSVRVTDILPTGLQLSGATAADDAMMRLWRDRLSSTFGYRSPHHDAYQFHMTFAYPIRWIEDSQTSFWQETLADILSDLQNEAPIIPLRSPAFCTFEDMTWFEEIVPKLGQNSL